MQGSGNNQKAMRASGGLRDERKNEKKNQKKNKDKDKKVQQQVKQKQQETKSKLGPVFLLPYDQEWPAIQKIHNRMILDELLSGFTSKVCDQWLLKKKNKLMKKYTEKSCEEIEEILQEIAEKKTEYANKNIKEIINSLKDNSRISNLSHYLLFGVNSVNRHLENKKHLSLLVVCRSAEPSLMTQHLLCQCLVTDIPSCGINGLSETISSVFDIKSTLAIGFKSVPDNPFEDVIEFIKDKIPDQDASSWVNIWKNKSTMESNNIETNSPQLLSKSPEIVLKNKDSAKEMEPSVTDHSVKRKRLDDTVHLKELNIEWKEIHPKKKKKK